MELRKGRSELYGYLTKRLSSFEPTEPLKWLLGLRWQAIFTTNYDRLLQRTYEHLKNPVQTPVTISATAELVQYDPAVQPPIYHLHGCLFGTPKVRLLLTEDDYAEFREGRRMLFEILKLSFPNLVFFTSIF